MEPGMNGLETYKQIIQMHLGQRAALTSGFSRTDLVAQAQALGVGFYLKKPYVLESLAKCIHAELHKTRTPEQGLNIDRP